MGTQAQVATEGCCNMNGVTASALLVFSALYIGVIVRELQPIRSVDEERGREGGGRHGHGQGDGHAGGQGQGGNGEAMSRKKKDGCSKCREDRCLAKGNSRVVKTIRTETVTERMEEGWAKVSERVVEVVTEEVTEKSKAEEEVCLRECEQRCKGGMTTVKDEESEAGAKEEKRGTTISEEESKDQ